MSSVFITLVSMAVKSLLMHKLRSFLTILGLIFGVASVIVMMAVAEGASETAQKQIESLGVKNIIVRSVKPVDRDTNDQSFGLEYGVGFDDMKRIQSILDSVTGATPQREYIHEARFRDQVVDARIVGIHPSYFNANQIQLASGRFLNQADEKYAKNVCVVGEGLAKKLFRNLSPIGRSVQVSNMVFFRIVGVTKWKAPSAGIGSSLSAQDYNLDIYIPLKTDHSRIGRTITKITSSGYKQETIELSQITVQVESTDSIRSTADAIDGLMAQFHRQKDFAITVPLDLLEQAKKTQQIFNFVLGATAAISLLVGGIGIMNIMLATVSERTREIGIRRALGARQKDIITQFLAETVVLSFAGSVIGLAFGVAIPSFVQSVTGMNTKITTGSVVIAVVVAMTVGILFGIYPARQAARLDPIQAIRHS